MPNSTHKIVVHHADSFGTPTVTGFPLPANESNDNIASVAFHDGTTTPTQIHELIANTPAGTRWVEVSFLATRQGEVQLVSENGKPNQTNDLATTNDHGCLITNKDIQVQANSDPQRPAIELNWAGGTGTIAPQAVVNGTALEDSLQKQSRRIQITRQGAIRTRVELHGKLSSADHALYLNYRIAIEVWAGIPGIRVDWSLSHEMPGVGDIQLNQAKLVGQWDLGGDAKRVFFQKNHTAMYVPRMVENPAPVTIIADHEAAMTRVQDPAMLLDDSEYPLYCAPGRVITAPWLQLQGQGGTVCASVANFIESMPNALTSSASELSYDFLPTDEPLVWPQGRRKQETIMLALSSSADAIATTDLAAQCLALSPKINAQPSISTLDHLDTFEVNRLMPYVPGENVRLNTTLAKNCELASPAGKWSLGDTPDWHYTRTYAGSPEGHIRMPGITPLPKTFLAGGSRIFPDDAAWFIEPVWTNNEYDAIHMLALELMRTGKDDHAQMLRWTSRHNIEVDFVHYSDDPGHHRASPFHSHFHNRKGAINSHFWTQGLIQYFCLTGDDDAMEVAKALGDKTIEINQRHPPEEWSFDREVGWALLSLICLVEIGCDEYLEESTRMIKFLREYDRKAFSGAIHLSTGKPGRSMERQMIDGAFGYASMIEAIDRYIAITDCQETKQWFEELLFELKDAFWEKVSEGESPLPRHMVGLITAIGYERTGDSDFLNAGEVTLDTHFDPQPGSLAEGPVAGQVKPAAMLYRGMGRLLGSLASTDRLKRFEYPAIAKHRASQAKQPEG